MAYVTFDKNSPANTQGQVEKIAIDDAALEKVAPQISRQADLVCTITEDQYNGLRLGTMKATHDGAGNASVETYPAIEPGPVVTSSDINDYVTVIRENWTSSEKVDKDDWLAYADSVAAIDLSGNTLSDLPQVVEAAGITYRALSQLPMKSA